MFIDNDRNLVALDNKGPTWQFFIGEHTFTDSTFPDDTDTTALALVNLDVPNDEKEMVMEMILGTLTADGLPLVRALDSPCSGLVIVSFTDLKYL